MNPASVLALVLGLRRAKSSDSSGTTSTSDTAELTVDLQLQRVARQLLHRETKNEPRNFNRSWDPRCATAGARKITVHDGRRNCGTLLADLDVHPRVAMQILRHAQVSLTMGIYTLASSAAAHDALKRLGDSLDA